MNHFGIVPPEPPRIHALDDCAPQFARAIERVVASLPHARIFETIRTDERQRWLFGFGRDYDDGRGLVTHAHSAQYGWHYFGAAADIIHDAYEWDAPSTWWDDLANVAEAHGLTSGARWKMADKPHVQHGACRTTPSDEARALYAAGGNAAVWKAVGAT